MWDGWVGDVKSGKTPKMISGDSYDLGEGSVREDGKAQKKTSRKG